MPTIPTYWLLDWAIIAAAMLLAACRSSVSSCARSSRCRLRNRYRSGIEDRRRNAGHNGPQARCLPSRAWWNRMMRAVVRTVTLCAWAAVIAAWALPPKPAPAVMPNPNADASATDHAGKHGSAGYKPFSSSAKLYAAGALPFAMEPADLWPSLICISRSCRQSSLIIRLRTRSRSSTLQPKRSYAISAATPIPISR
jgi:hypothetical protein